jgi:hypothetical protein
MSGLNGKSLLLALCVLSSPETINSALAAKFEASSLGPDKIPVITVEGDLMPGDEKNFINVALSMPNAIVFLHSDGGDLNAGIEIGKAIRLKGYGTFVPDGMSCASACALAWLGGRVRLMGKNALVGFHAAFSKSDRQVTSAGNALVGAYLNQLGLPSSAVVYITETPPNDIRWLSLADAQKVGIEVKLLDEARPVSPPVGTGATPNTRQTASKSVETQNFVQRYWNGLSQSYAASFVAQVYAPEVRYFGRMKGKAEVTKEKVDFFQRWPRRKYTLDVGSPSVSCDGELCSATGQVSWEMFSDARGSASRGSASFILTVDWSTGQPLIVEESSEVRSRKVASLSASSAEHYNVDTIYQGDPVYPDFKGRDRPFVSYRTRIRDGVRQGPNFAGRYSLIQFGCGTGCSGVFFTDVSTGKVFSFPRGGEANMYLNLKFSVNSYLLSARWFGTDSRCVEEKLVWKNEEFSVISKRDVGNEDACLVAEGEP